MGRGCIPACHWAGVCVCQHAIGQGCVYASMQLGRGCDGGVHPPENTPTLVNKWAVCVLLECFLVSQVFVHGGRGEEVCIHGVVCLGVYIRAFVSTRPLVHKHVKISVDEWIMETTHPHKQVQIPKNQFFCLTLLGMIISHLHFI